MEKRGWEHVRHAPSASTTLGKASLQLICSLLPDAVPNQLSPLFTDTTDMPASEILARLEGLEPLLGWESTTESARKWWEAVKIEKCAERDQIGKILRLA